MVEVIKGSFDDFDELAAVARGWSLELSKLDRAPFSGDLFQWITKGLILSRGRFSSHLRQEGSPPPGLRTMTVHIARNMSQYWRGRQVTGDDLLIFPAASEVDTVSDPRFDIFTISFDEDALLAQADKMGCAAVSSCLQGVEVLRREPRSLDRLRRTLFEVVRDSGKATDDPEVIKWNLQAEVIRLLERTDVTSRAAPQSERRLRIVRDAQNHLAQHAGEYVTVQDLSRAVGVSIRTLQYAFQDHIGIGPKAYVNALRLNAARKELRAAPTDATCVADVANRLGFWHMGQFAADYRRHFGENPSSTLAHRPTEHTS